MSGGAHRYYSVRTLCGRVFTAGIMLLRARLFSSPAKVDSIKESPEYVDVKEPAELRFTFPGLAAD